MLLFIFNKRQPKVLDSFNKWCYYSNIMYIEDLFISLSDLVVVNKISYQPQDYNPILSFRTIIKHNNHLTEKQGKFVLTLIQKYKKQYTLCTGEQINIEDFQWRNTFRTIDYTKSLELSNTEDGYPCAVLRFPYNLKDIFDETFGGSFLFDSISKTREIPLLSINPIKLLEFCVSNDFTVDPEFLDYVHTVEEVWDQEDDLSPHCVIENDQVKLINAVESAQEYFDKNKFDNVYKDIWLARMCGFPLYSNATDSVSSMCKSEATHFYTKSIETMCDVLAKLDLDTVAIVLDRQSDTEWFIDNMIDNLQKKCYNTDKIRVCFRGANDNEEGKKFNNWIKMNNLGGKIETGNIFIFKHSIAKWAKKSTFEPKLVISNALYESTNISTRNFLKKCHANITVSDTKPTTRKDTQIVEL